MDHEQEIRKILSKVNSSGQLSCRESNTVEFKQSINMRNFSTYARTMASFANNRGGYIVFGIKDNPREIVGINPRSIEDFKQEEATGSLNSLFSPSIEWEFGSLSINVNGEVRHIAWLYTNECDRKPIMATKENNEAKVTSGDILYRYRAKSEKIKYAEMNRLIEEHAEKEREKIFKLYEMIRNSDISSIGIINYGSGKLTTPNGVEFILEPKIVSNILKKAKFIKEGSFHETQGTPVLKIVGSLDLVEEIRVPNIDVNVEYPYIQKELAFKLNITVQQLYAMIWFHEMKGTKKFHLEVKSSGKYSLHKFSEHALEFLKEKIEQQSHSEQDMNHVFKDYQNRNKGVEKNDG